MFLGDRLKDLRINKNLTQDELGKMLNVTKVSVCCYEKGKRTPSLDTLSDLSDVFGVSVDYFLGNDVSVIKEDSPEYSYYFANEEINFIKELRLNRKLYELALKDSKRFIELMNKKIK